MINKSNNIITIILSLSLLVLLFENRIVSTITVQYSNNAIPGKRFFFKLLSHTYILL